MNNPEINLITELTEPSLHKEIAGNSGQHRGGNND